MEFILRRLFGSCESGVHELGVELAVHYSEYDEVDESDYEERSAESDRGKDGIVKLL